MDSGGPSPPAVSVVIPVYNRAAGLGAALESVQQQSFADFEVIIVDDGSNDDPATVVGDLGDPRFRLIHQANSGAGAARNLAIDAARGRYVAFLDSDDMFLPHHLSDAIAELKIERFAAVYAPVIMDRGDGTSIVKPPRALREGENVASYLMSDGGFVPTSTLVVDAGVARRVRYNELIRFGQDTDFAIRLALAGVAIHMLGRPGAIVNDRQTASRLSLSRNLSATEKWLEGMRDKIPSRAYWAYRGQYIARFVAFEHKGRALVMSATAILRGAYGPKRAVAVFLQVLLSDTSYRRLTRFVVRHDFLLKLTGFNRATRRDAGAWH